MSDSPPDSSFRLPSGPGIALAHGCGGGYRARPATPATTTPPGTALPAAANAEPAIVPSPIPTLVCPNPGELP